MAITITEIKTSLDGLVTVVQTAVEYIKSLDDQLAAAIAAQADPAVLQAISDEIATATTTLSAAIPAPPAA
jgi:hypothetical protein